MKLLVINGSPKGEWSITLQTALYLEKLNPDITFTYYNAAAKIKAAEKDFTEAKDKITESDAILFSYPVYSCMAPAQLHRFIRLMMENGINLENKFATQITTSKHFYDMSAHKWLELNLRDMGAKVIEGLSSDMDDLVTEKGQKDAEEFFKHFLWSMENNVFITEPYTPSKSNNVNVTYRDSAEKKSGKVVIVADIPDNESNLAKMVERFRNALPYETDLVNLHDFNFRGGCLGCLNCSPKGECVYKDGFRELLDNRIHSGIAIVEAFKIEDHSMGYIIKTYDDRQFCNGHRTVTAGMPFGFLVSGNLSEEPNLDLVIKGRCGVGDNYLAGIATDEYDPDGEIDKLAANLAYALENGYTQPQNFLGVGGKKIFRDLIWLMRGMMKADHAFYKSHGLYDFPQNKKGTVIKMKLVGSLITNPKIKAKMGNRMNEGMLSPYKKVIENSEPTEK